MRFVRRCTLLVRETARGAHRLCRRPGSGGGRLSAGRASQRRALQHSRKLARPRTLPCVPSAAGPAHKPPAGHWYHPLRLHRCRSAQASRRCAARSAAVQPRRRRQLRRRHPAPRRHAAAMRQAPCRRSAEWNTRRPNKCTSAKVLCGQTLVLQSRSRERGSRRPTLLRRQRKGKRQRSLTVTARLPRLTEQQVDVPVASPQSPLGRGERPAALRRAA